MHKLLVIIPAYNEAATISKLSEALTACGAFDIADVLVINDASTDKTGALLTQFNLPHINCVYNLGYGSALQLGYKYAERHDYKYVIQMDADGQHDVSNIGRLYAALKGADTPDIVIGSRFIEGSQAYPVPRVRRLAIKLFSFIIRATTGERIQDPTSGLQGLSRRAFAHYARFNQFNSRYPDANMIVQMILCGFRVREIPAVMHARDAGVGMHTGIIKPILYMLTMSISILAVVWRERAERRVRNR